MPSQQLLSSREHVHVRGLKDCLQLQAREARQLHHAVKDPMITSVSM